MPIGIGQRGRHMAFEKAFIPYGVYWSTPFCRWQGSLGRLSSLELAAKVARQTLTDKRVAFERLDNLILGFTVPGVGVTTGCSTLSTGSAPSKSAQATPTSFHRARLPRAAA